MCESAWHGSCFIQHKCDNFPVLQARDLDDSLVDESVLEDDDPKRFKEGREGDHLMTPFQCPECHFFNIKKRLPLEGNHVDELALLCIQRAILDSLWARERSTVNSNRLEGKKFLAMQRALGFEVDCLPARGPYPKEDSWGMGIACGMLLRSKDPGRNTATIQYETLRKQRSFFSNYVHTCNGGVGSTFVKDDGTGASVSNSKTNQLWFKRFMLGCHRRMGDVWMPDRALSQYELNSCFEVLEVRWRRFIKDQVGRKKVSITACILIAGYYAALRGEEINRVDIGAMRKYWTEAVTHIQHPHIPLMLAGTFKREVGQKLFCQPLVSKTRGGRKIEVWFNRLLNIQGEEGVVRGPMFRGRTGKRMSIAEMDEYLHVVLLEVQRQFPRILSDTINVQDEFSVYRSLRRGATSEAQNAQIPKEVIEANNRWRKLCRAKGLTPGGSMMERYTDARISVQALTRFSYDLP
jgi:hypothetical protein